MGARNALSEPQQKNTDSNTANAAEAGEAPSGGNGSHPAPAPAPGASNGDAHAQAPQGAPDAPPPVIEAPANPAPKDKPAPRRNATSFLPPPDSPFAPALDSYRQDPVAAPEAQAHLAQAARTNTQFLPANSALRLRSVVEAVPKPPPDPLLVVEGIKKNFGRREVVRGVDLQVGRGEIVGLLGRNGAGKTTTFRMIMGILHPDSGRVRFDFRDITNLPMYERANRGIGYLAQEPSVFQRLTVAENLMAVLELQLPDRKEREDRLEVLISELGLHTVRDSQASTLSGGERRRLEIARASTLQPQVVLFDEPFAGIDPIAVNEIQNILRDLKRVGVGVLITDHNVRETLKITDRTYIMDEGRIWIHGSPQEILNHPEARQRYLGHDFRLDF